MKKYFTLLPFASSFLFVRCSDDIKLASLAIKKGKKVYLVPFIADKESVELDLSGAQTPTISKSVQIVEDHGELFIEPKDFKRINTDKIGQQINKQTIVLRNISEGKSHEIIWTKSPKLKAEKNCVIKRLWFVEHP